MNRKARAIAFYLPQFHPVEANDKYWGKGFTEWTNVSKAKPLYRGHKQPHLPSDLGFYDLRVSEVREEQAKLASEAGIEGFCYWHYWFGNGERVLERIFSEVVDSGEPDFPFCLGWANDSWTGHWYGADDDVIFEQKYPGEEDYRKHFECILPALKDKRYIEINEKKLFVIYRPDFIPDLDEFTFLWQKWAKEEGLKGFYFISNCANVSDFQGDACIDGFVENVPLGQRNRFKLSFGDRILKSILEHFFKTTFDEYMLNRKSKPFVRNYTDYVEFYENSTLKYQEIPSIAPNWDNTPRSENLGFVLQGSTPELFRRILRKAIELVSDKSTDEKIIFIKSWNEWAEGNYLEPDMEWGRKYLDICQEELIGD